MNKLEVDALIKKASKFCLQHIIISRVKWQFIGIGRPFHIGEGKTRFSVQGKLRNPRGIEQTKDLKWIVAKFKNLAKSRTL